MSLVEVLVASGLLAAAIAALMHLFVLAVQANVDARDTTYATVLAAQKIEELRAELFLEPSVVESTDYLDLRGHRVDGAASQQALYDRRWTIEPLPPHPRDAVVISVVVSRRGAPSQRAVRLTTIRARKDSVTGSPAGGGS